MVIPAHNEELLLPRALRAIEAAGQLAGAVEVIVVANRCTDATAELARAAAPSSSRTPPATSPRSATPGRRGTGDVLADDRRRLRHVAAHVPRGRAAPRHRSLRRRRDEGGPERRSAGILATYAMVEVLLRSPGSAADCSGVAVRLRGGRRFRRSLPLAEDLDFARRLRAHGKRTGRVHEHARPRR